MIFPLDGSQITLGRDSSCIVSLSGIGVSRHHASILLSGPEPVIEDLQSRFGLRLNGTRLSSPATLKNNDKIIIGVQSLTVRLEEGSLFLDISSGKEEEEEEGRTEISGTTESSAMRIGREPGSQVHLPHMLVSRHHATAKRLSGSEFLITDNRSTNGTFVNGRPVSSCKFTEDDILQVGPYRLFLDGGKLVRVDDSNRIKLEVSGVNVRRGGTALLSDINLIIPSGEFVAVLGPSGAGKSTLIRALTGRMQVNSGEIYANGLPMGQFLSAFASNIGYVSQENLLYQELTVEETFHEQSLLRLPRDSIFSERQTRIDEVIELIDLKRVSGHRVSSLSGGEAKRVHLGIELLSSPAMIFLDEPLAGLDPGLVRRFMALFRRISDQGHTLILTTHTLEQLELCNRVVFLNRGRIVFQGMLGELEAAFKATSIAQIYEKVSETNKLQSVTKDSKPAAPVLKTGNCPPAKIRKPRVIPFHRQVALLVTRYFRILIRDRRNLFLMMIQAPLIAVLLGLVFRGGTGFLPLSFYFCITVSVIWIGGINTIREIAREWTHLRRDNRAGLSLTAYIISKVILSAGVSLLQGLLFGLSLKIIFSEFELTTDVILLIVSGTISGALLGLCISSWSGHVGRAITILPILFIPQIFFLRNFDSLRQNDLAWTDCFLYDNFPSCVWYV